MKVRSNKITGPNAGGPCQLPIRTSLAAGVGQFCRWATSNANNNSIMHVKKYGLRLIGVACLLLLATGCSTPSPTGTSPSQQTPQQPTTRDGLLLSDAQDKALKLQPGMTQDQVQALLGRPDETAARTYGSQTPRPWNGIEWTYRWGGWRAKRLQIVFEHGTESWLVNSWKWFDF
jgi:hypothetical protein